MNKLKKWLGLEMYVSDLDLFLNEYNKKNPNLSKSQKKELDQHLVVRSKRDHVSEEHPKHLTLIQRFLN